MGEVLFVDEFEDNLTVYHPEGDWVISHYTREVRDDGYWCICHGLLMVEYSKKPRHKGTN